MSLPPPSPDSIAVVTGASSGIGEQIARLLSAKGHRVALVARREHRLARLADELGGDGRAVPVRADLAEPEDRDQLVARLDELGAVEILVNNAGMGLHLAFIDANREQELKQVRVNVEAVVDLMARYLPGMVERGRGAVINIASSGGFQPLPYSAGYGASKGHVLLLSEAVNQEVKRKGVTVTAICPGPVQTDFHETYGSGFTRRYPRVAWVSAERVAANALAAADRGRRSVVPGSRLHKLGFGIPRHTPSWLTLPVATRFLVPPVQRECRCASATHWPAPPNALTAVPEPTPYPLRKRRRRRAPDRKDG
jgi:short-subunit dehydrogenase